MDNATNYELNLDKELEKWIFRVRFRGDEVILIHKACENPHEGYTVNSDLMDRARFLAKRLANRRDMAESGEQAMFMMDLTFHDVWAIVGLIQNLAADVRMEDNVDRIAEHIYFQGRHLIDHARNNAVS